MSRGMTKTNDILAPEILAHLTIAPDLKVGDLAVFTDYKGRQVGARVTRIEGGDVDGRVCGLETYQHGVYRIGDAISRPAKFVRGAC